MTVTPLFDVSVVMPVHNKAPHVLRAVESVLNQSVSDFELIIVDDASTDGSARIIASINDERVRVFRRDRPGIGGYEARNLGIEKATKSWIAFLDSDDEWMPNHLAAMLQLSERMPEANFLSCGWLVSDAGACSENPFFAANRSRPNIRFDCVNYLRTQASGYDIANTNVVVLRKNLLERIGKFPIPSPRCKRAGDGQTWLRAMLGGAIMGWSAHIGAIYYQDAVNMVTRTQQYSIDENGLITFIQQYLKTVPDGATRRLLKKYMNNRILSVIFQHARQARIERRDLAMALGSFQWDPRLVFIVSGLIAPRATQHLLARLAPGGLGGQ